MIDYIEIKAPAKINFGLNVISKREDGFHNLETIFYPLKDLYDELRFTRSNKFEFTCSDKELETDDNLIIRAKNLLENESKKKINVRIELQKNIPLGAGLGGGSSDAAATLLSLNDMFGLKYDLDKLRSFALQLGSDVPFFISAKPAFAESRGEKLTLIDFEIPYPIVLVNPGIHISTAEAYKNIKSKPAMFNLKDLTNIKLTEPSDYITKVTNDFEDYAFNKHPEIEEIKEKLYSFGAKLSLMTGSGSTVFGIFNSFNEAEKAKVYFAEKYFAFINLPEEYDITLQTLN
ncbi:MAG: 4-(cytidine 5'-diphospho)-2-C-methyl-D-erythritol kinase [Ignavibacteriales bacterium]|nr:MAG: 4-(cytidine 5'-diphospho)-2-C-methyl-D-erythritol kinase [Ignavibacteriales bacterium]